MSKFILRIIPLILLGVIWFFMDDLSLTDNHWFIWRSFRILYSLIYKITVSGFAPGRVFLIVQARKTGGKTMGLSFDLRFRKLKK